MDCRAPSIIRRSSGVIRDGGRRRYRRRSSTNCHVGTFTPAGTFDAAVERLGYLRDLGVTHVELMPVGEFSGTRGWGYDGVDLYAPHHSYGGPDAMKRFVDAAHGHGLGVILDVVYNHLGPEGNYLGKFGPYFTDRYRTPWGDAVNLDDRDSDEVRRFFCDNALMWLRDYRVDGLRLDAVHAIFDASAIHFLEQLGAEVHELEAEVGRHLVVIAESDLNLPRIVTAREAGGYGLDAQWNDDFHHALHTILTGETAGYLADFGSIAQLAKTSYPRLRVRRHIFEESPAKAWQAGARAFGASIRRVHAESRSGRQSRDGRASWASGDDGSTQDFRGVADDVRRSSRCCFRARSGTRRVHFSTSPIIRTRQLAESVRKGRRAEFAHFVANASEIPDPQASQTFERSKLDWDERERGEHREIFEWYRQLIRLRRCVRDFENGRLDLDAVNFDEAARWIRVSRGDSRRDLQLRADAAAHTDRARCESVAALRLRPGPAFESTAPRSICRRSPSRS